MAKKCCRSDDQVSCESKNQFDCRTVECNIPPKNYDMETKDYSNIYRSCSK